MQYKRTGLIIAVFIVLIFFSSCSRTSYNGIDTKPCNLKEFHMGTIIIERVYGKNADKAARKAMDKIAGLEAVMTINREGSKIDDLNAKSGQVWVKLDPEIIHVLETANKFSRLSDGVFDVTIGPLVKAWGVFTDHPRVPGTDEINRLKILTNYQDLCINKAKSEAMLKRKGQIVDLGGIAKGYAADAATEIYKKYGVKSAFVNLGGNIKVVGGKPDGTPWVIGIQNPRALNGKTVGYIKVKDKTVVSSGDYQRYFTENNKRYHHILDPRTGCPAESGLIGTTVVADKSIDADALSTTLFILGLEKGRNLVQSLKGIEAIFITGDKKIYVTDGLKSNFIFNDESKEFKYVKEG